MHALVDLVCGTAYHSSTCKYPHSCESWLSQKLGDKYENRQPCCTAHLTLAAVGEQTSLLLAAQLSLTRRQVPESPSHQCGAEEGHPPSVKFNLEQTHGLDVADQGGTGCVWVASGMTPGRDRRALP